MNISKFLNLSRNKKRVIFFVTDCLFVALSLYCAFALRYGTASPWEAMLPSWIMFPALTLIGSVIVWALHLDRIKLNAFDAGSITRIGVAAVLLSMGAIAISYTLDLSAPRSVPVLSGVFFCLFSVGIRLSGMALLHRLAERDGLGKPVAIYGAGAAGIQLAAALRQAHEAHPMFFIDDNSSLHRLTIAGLKVYNPNYLNTLIEKYKIEQILLAVPSMKKSRRAIVIEKLKTYNIEVQVLPSFVELMSGKKHTTDLRTVAPDALLGRDKVALSTPEIEKIYAGRVVMVTGAGGAIGSELCRQLLNCNPARIILFEQGEFQLYSINQEMQAESKTLNIPIVARLGSVTNKARVAHVIAQEGVDVILHAAAYKHVPLVEGNELEGAENNILGTQIVAEAADTAKIERFILISTDKAAHPANIMDATKRMAELVVQDIQTRSLVTKFTMVRFGNVLGASGSVLPLFQKQIAQGGPVRIPDLEITRFFMTIPEATRLILLAGAYATGGDVFVLNMGQPQKIVDIARRMIVLSGHSVKDPVTEEGDISIEITGMRPGEKLDEELLINKDCLSGTPHAKILRVQDVIFDQIEVAGILEELHAAMTDADSSRLCDLLIAKMDGYHVQSNENKIG